MKDLRKVLVVDDEPVVCRSYERVLSGAGFDVVTAQSGVEAIAATLEQRFDVVIADLRMPDMNGLEVTQAVQEASPGVRVIIVTGYPSPDSIQRARQLGVFSYLLKPVAPDDLAAATQHAVGATPAPAPVPVEPAGKASPAAAPCAAPAAEARRAPAPSAPPAEAPAPARHPAAAVVALLAAPLIGLAYVILFPFIGLAMLGALALRGLVRKVRVAR